MKMFWFRVNVRAGLPNSVNSWFAVMGNGI